MADTDKKDMPEKSGPEILEKDTAQDTPSPPSDMTAEKKPTPAIESEAPPDPGKDAVPLVTPEPPMPDKKSDAPEKFSPKVADGDSLKMQGKE